MRGGWSRFGLYVAVVATLVVVVLFATSGAERGAGEVLAQLLFIGAMAYLLTFLVWPRRTGLSRRHPAMAPPSATDSARSTRPTPDVDERPVLVIGPRPAGSRPGAEIHIRDTPVERPSRGRRPSERQVTGEMRWPTR